jgi:hypothetical protein
MAMQRIGKRRLPPADDGVSPAEGARMASNARLVDMKWHGGVSSMNHERGLLYLDDFKPGNCFQLATLLVLEAFIVEFPDDLPHDFALFQVKALDRLTAFAAGSQSARGPVQKRAVSGSECRLFQTCLRSNYNDVDTNHVWAR